MKNQVIWIKRFNDEMLESQLCNVQYFKVISYVKKSWQRDAFIVFSESIKKMVLKTFESKDSKKKKDEYMNLLQYRRRGRDVQT